MEVDRQTGLNSESSQTSVSGRVDSAKIKPRILWLPGNCKADLLSFQKREGRKEGADLEDVGGVVRGGEDAARLHT